jgi:dTDP-4-dehydrorhamnose reductase
MMSGGAGNVVVIFGASGMLGATLAKHLSKNDSFVVLSYDRSAFAVTRGADVVSSLTTLSQSWPVGRVTVINAIGVIPQKVDLVTQQEMFIRVNSVFPHQLYHFCCARGARLIHISTDCVFDGFGSGNYAEDAEHTETTIYGASKSCGEPMGASIIRTSIIGEEISGKKSLLEWLRAHKGETVKGYSNHMWNGVTTLQLSKVIEHILVHAISWAGVRHVVSPEAVSKLALLRLIDDVYSLRCTIEPFEPPRAIDKTLQCSKDARIAEIDVPPLRRQLEELMIFWQTVN